MIKTKRIILIIFLITILTFAGIKTFSEEDDWICVNGEWIKHGNPSAPKPISFCEKTCILDADCETPGEFLMQSNCPFSSACINNKCSVICPLSESACEKNQDCNCSWRGDRTIECLCLKNECVSVEKK